MADIIPLFPTPQYVVIQVSFQGQPGGRREAAIRRCIGIAGNAQVPGDCWSRTTRDSILWTRVREIDAERIEAAIRIHRGTPMRVGGESVDAWLAELEEWEAAERERRAS